MTPDSRRRKLPIRRASGKKTSARGCRTSPRAVIERAHPTANIVHHSSNTAVQTVTAATRMLRVGSLKDSSRVARRLAPVRFVLCASPGYVKQYGAPREPDDLSNHRCLFYSLRAVPGEWRFRGRTAKSPCASADDFAPTTATSCMPRRSRAPVSASLRLLSGARTWRKAAWSR